MVSLLFKFLHNTTYLFIFFYDNTSIFSYRIRPRFLRDVSKRDLSATVLGTKVSMPLGISPTAMQKMAHHLGEVASAKGNVFFGIVFSHYILI